MICPNCQKYIVPNAPYCSHCGQKTALNDEFKLKTVLGQFFGNVFSVDSKVLKTLMVLIVPGHFYTHFLEGKRERYMHPLRLFVFFNLFLFGLITANTNDAIPTKNTGFKGDFEWGELTIDSTVIQKQSIAEIAAKYPQENGIDEFIFKQLLHLYKDGNAYTKAVLNRLPWMLFLFIPLIAFFGFLLERKKKASYLKHFLLWTNIVSAFILIFALDKLLLPSNWEGFVAIVCFLPVFTFWSLQSTMPTPNIVLRILKWVVYLLCMLLCILISLVFVLLVGFIFF